MKSDYFGLSNRAVSISDITNRTLSNKNILNNSIRNKDIQSKIIPLRVRSSQANLFIPFSRKPTMQRVMQSLFEEYIACRADEELEEEHFLMLQIEKAHWKYDQLSETNTNLRKIKMLKSFVPLFIEKNILDSEIKARIDKKCQAFLQHQITRERAGVILVDKNNTHCVLVENYHLPGCWSFPKGAIENKESPLECAIRECREETGYDCKNAIQHSTAIVKEIKKKYKLTLYIIQGIDMTKHILRPTVKREIKSIKWFEISKMPETIGKQLVYGKTFPTDQKFGILYYFAKDLKNLNNANKEN